MWTWLRRMFWLSLVCSAWYAAYTAWQRRNEPVPGGPPEWPPLSESSRTTSAGASGSAATTRAPDGPPEGGWSTGTPVADEAAAEVANRWVEPIDGACPDGYPIKANANSGIFHVPGGRFYERTVPERCYTDEASAEADGYRRSKA
jgi:hypothetical protein